MIELTSYERTLGALPEGVTSAEVNAERIAETSIYVRNGKIAQSEAFTRTRLYVRATGERTGLAYTENLDEDAREVILRALENSKYATAAASEKMRDGARMSLKLPGAREGVKEMLRLGADAERLLSGAEVVFLKICATAREMRTINSRGLDVSSETNCASAELSVRIPRPGGEAAEGLAFITASELSGISAAALAEAALNDARGVDGGGLAPIRIPGGKYDAVLSGRVMRNILMTAWQEFSGAAMRAGSSIFKGEAGELVGSEALNIINAPAHPNIGQSFPVDSEGTVVSETTIVSKGRLVSPLYTIGTASAAGRVTTGCAGRVARMTGDLPIVITTVPALFYVLPGENSRDALISQMRTGIELTYSLDLFHSVNVASGEFSIPCGGVYWENGKPVGALSQITVAGNLRELFNSIEAVGDDLDFDDFYFKTYCVGSPSALARGLIFAS